MLPVSISELRVLLLRVRNLREDGYYIRSFNLRIESLVIERQMLGRGCRRRVGFNLRIESLVIESTADEFAAAIHDVFQSQN